jgi:ATF/CREB family transcription factor
MALIGNTAGTNTGPTITPNTLSAITGALNSTQSVPNSYPHQQDSNNPAYLASASNAASTAANGLFLLSQAHQELTKREEAQARAGGNATANIVNGNAVQQNGRRGNGVKRKSYDNASPPPPVPSVSQTIPSKAGKRTRSAVAPRRKGSEHGISEGAEDDEDDDEMEDIDAEEIDNSHPPPPRKGAKKPETEEEKRRNFLERNRQGEVLLLYITTPFESSLIFPHQLLSNAGNVKRHGLHNSRPRSNT